MATIQEFFQGQDVFITGSTGFMGKVLLEKLLRSCHGLNKVYVLIRPKKGKDIHQRISDIVNMPLFDCLRKECPERLSKIVPVSGDVTEIGLGLSESNRKILEENVSIVYHSAASVRFDDPLRYATLLNTRGAREVMLLVRNMNKLKSFVHVSTSYCNCDKGPEVQEVMYPPHADWKEMIRVVEDIDDNILNILTPKILDKLPNTYLFTKSLAEHVVNDLGQDLPTVIYRPSIVISSINDPIPGWVDNFNGPIGLLIGAGKGVLRVSYADPDTVMDYMPVDIAIKGIIISSWYRATCGVLPEPHVYNGCSGDKRNVSMSKLIDLGMKAGTEVPLENMIWRESGFVTRNKLVYYSRLFLTHLLPAVVIDAIIKLCGKEPLLLRLHRRIFLAQIALFPFLSNTWFFHTDNFIKLREEVRESDKKEFSFEGAEYIDDLEYFKQGIIGARAFLLKESPDTIPQSRKHRERLIWLDRFVKATFYGVVVWYLYSYLQV